MQGKRLLFLLFMLLFAATVGGWFVAKKYALHPNEGPSLSRPQDNITGTDQFHASGAGDNITVLLYYPSGGAADNASAGQAEGISSEEIHIAYDVLPAKLAEEIIPEYLKRLQGSLRDTRLLGVYKDRENILYVDFSDDFRRGFAGDAQQEYYLLKSLFKTLTGGIPGITDVKLLLEGREVEVLGGHFSTLYPLGSFLSEQAVNPPLPEQRS